VPSRDANLCHPDLKPKLLRWLELATSAHLSPLVTCTYRSQSEQDALYAQGRTAPGKKVTWTRRSNHSFTIGGKPASLAFDFVPLISGKPTWNAKDPSWLKLGEIAESLGLVWGGRWTKAKDLPHIELPNAKDYWK
jgi:peptidoglycan L-alanyl-D-glutamate endopeptidase CwlK